MHQSLRFGAGSLAGVASIIEAEGARRILLVTGRQSFESSGAKRILEPLLHDREVERFSNFHPNPKLEDAERGASVVRAWLPDLILAVGGGSVIDMAKLIRIFATQTSAATQLIHDSKRIANRGAPLIAAPTTAGAGSEATHFAVVYVGSAKYSLAHPYILPDHAVVDATLTHNLPPKLTAVSGFDALCQAIESYWSVGSTADSRQLAEAAITRLWRSLHTAVHTPTPQSREDMAYGAHVAGKAINLSKTTAPHALSYALTQKFGVPHGHAVAITLGKFIELNAAAGDADVTDARGAAHLRGILGNLCGLLGQSTPARAASAFYSTMQACGLDTDLNSLGVRARHIDAIVGQVNTERLRNHPVRLTPAALSRLMFSLKDAGHF